MKKKKYIFPEKNILSNFAQLSIKVGTYEQVRNDLVSL